MSAEEFDLLARGFELLKYRRKELESTHKTTYGLLNHFHETKQLSGYIDEDGQEWDINDVKENVRETLWGGRMVYCALLTAEKPYEELVFMNSMKTWDHDDGTYDYDKHHDEAHEIMYKEYDVAEWLGRGYSEAKTEYLVADLMLNQYIFEHTDPVSKAHKEAKYKLLSHRDYYKTKEAWDKYASEVSEWHSENNIPLDTPELVV